MNYIIAIDRDGGWVCIGEARTRKEADEEKDLLADPSIRVFTIEEWEKINDKRSD